MRPLPVYFQEPFLSALGTMMFPEEPEKAEALVALRLSRSTDSGPGVLTTFEDDGGEWPPSMIRRHRRILGSNGLTEAEIGRAWDDGLSVGKVAEVLLAMIEHHPDRAAWAAAAKIVAASPGVRQTSPQTFLNKRRELASTVHLWTAWSLRDGKIDGREDFDAFIMESEFVLGRFENWTSTLRDERRAELGSPFRPYAGWNPPAEVRIQRPGPLTDAQMRSVPPVGRPRNPPKSDSE